MGSRIDLLLVSAKARMLVAARVVGKNNEKTKWRPANDDLGLSSNSGIIKILFSV